MSSRRSIKSQTSLWVDGNRVMEPPEWAEEVKLLNSLFQFFPDITATHAIQTQLVMCSVAQSRHGVAYESVESGRI
jgi:hypothetical protein